MNKKLKLINELEKISKNIKKIQTEIKLEKFTIDELSYLLQVSNDLLHISKIQFFVDGSIDLNEINEKWIDYMNEYADDIRKQNIRFSDARDNVKNKIFKV